MQNYYKTISAIATATALVAGTASAEIESTIHAGYSSEYLFRGAILGQDMVETGVAASTEVYGLGLSAGAWYASFEKGAADTDFDELDLFAEVSKDLGFATAAVGYIHYNNLRALADDAQEVSFSLDKSFFGVDFSLNYFWDIETDNNGYSELAAAKGFEISECLTCSTGAVLGYLAEEGDFNNLSAKVALDWALNDSATLSPFVAHSWGFEALQNEAIAGSILSVSF